ncbi:MAG: bifunctional pyr operon transcriptional regulator/uracil phosphoribosyltransferase [Phycisphaeraceae bacterium]|nr:bifunctional pyr operon transcriptional regulator/uracil phosphoribosyltransferase [Phycisphaeraceae bacterium]
MRQIADAQRVSMLIDQLADAIKRDMSGTTDPWAIVGIRSRGDLLAQRLAGRLNFDHIGVLDITLYRDDLSEIGMQPTVRTTEIPFAIDRMQVVLVDDVLMTGRSVRAALQSLMDLGRPRRVWLAVLVDRGGRELPIRPDYVAFDLAQDDSGLGLAPDNRVEVMLQPTDPEDGIVVCSSGPQVSI